MSSRAKVLIAVCGILFWGSMWLPTSYVPHNRWLRLLVFIAFCGVSVTYIAALFIQQSRKDRGVDERITLSRSERSFPGD